jgi:hypothetical protein
VLEIAPAFHASGIAILCRLFPLTVALTAFAHVTAAHGADGGVSVGVAVGGEVGVVVGELVAVGVFVGVGVYSHINSTSCPVGKVAAMSQRA